jgi:hypothetical protein
MKRIISSILLLCSIASVICSFAGCTKTPEEAHATLYDWLIDNGTLEGGTILTFSSGQFQITADSSENITVYYNKGQDQIGGYSSSYKLPLFSSEETTAMEITLTKKILDDKDNFIFNCILTPSTYRENVPLSYEDVTLPSKKSIYNVSYGEYQQVSGSLIRKFVPYPDKADEFYRLKKYNDNLEKEINQAKKSAIDNSHAAIAEILSWLKTDIYKYTGLTLSDLGFNEYK